MNRCLRLISKHRLLLLIFGPPALLVTVVSIWVHLLTVSKYHGLALRMRTLDELISSQKYTRPVLQGAPVPGTAWDEYCTAELEIRTCGHLGREPLSYTYLYPQDPITHDDQARLDRFLVDHPEVINTLRHGTRKMNHSPAPLALHMPTWKVIPLLGEITRAQLARDGNLREAAQLCLDFYGLGLDLLGNGIPDQGLLDYSTEGLRKVIRANNLGGDTLLEIERALTLLEPSLPSAATQVRRRAHYIITAWLTDSVRTLSTTGGGRPSFGTTQTWRYGLSSRLLVACGLEDLEYWAGRFQDVDAMTGVQFRDLCAELEAARKESNNPVFRSYCDYDTEAANWLERRTALRLLRVAAHYSRTGELLTLRDAYGELIAIREASDTVTFWSVGRKTLEGELRNGTAGHVAVDRAVEVLRSQK